MGKLFTRRARFGKTVEAAGGTLIGKQGEDFFFRNHGLRTTVISCMKGFHLVFYSNFAPLRLILLIITAIHDLRKKEVFRSIHGGSLSLCVCRRARIKGPAGRIWRAGLSLPMSVLECKVMKPRCCR